jgi:hypothetical protein
VRRRRRPRLSELRARLARLRKTSDWLTSHAALGAALRADIAAAGSPTWRPCEDLSWRRWVEREGDEEVRSRVAAIDELIEEMVARAKAGDQAEEGS